MHKLRKYLKVEMDAEFFACVHGASMIFIYGFMLWLAGNAMVLFSVIVEMLILGYVIAWTQKGLFWQEKAYGKREYMVRETLWNVLPMIYMPIAGYMCDWFVGVATWVPVTFYVIMDCYVVMVWIFLRYVYKEDTDELNHLIQQRKKDIKDSREE